MDGIKKRNLYESSILCEVDFDVKPLKYMVELNTLLRNTETPNLN